MKQVVGYVVRNNDRWYAGKAISDLNIDACTDNSSDKYVFPSKHHARLWIDTREAAGWAERGYWKIYRLVKNA